MRPPRVIRRILLLLYPLVPVVAVPIESANAMPVYADIIAAKDPCSRLVLVSHGQGVVEPIGDVGAPLSLPPQYQFAKTLVYISKTSKWCGRTSSFPWISTSTS